MSEQLATPIIPLLDDEHLAEQRKTQEGKNQSRWLSDYDDVIFRQSTDYDPVKTVVSETLRPSGYEGFMSLSVLLELMRHRKGGKLNIVDMGAGAGIAMRELASQPRLRGEVETTIVDLFNVGTEVFDDLTQQHINENPEIMSSEAEPHFIQADAEKVVMRPTPDLVMSIESIQYLDNPLAAIVNWYNQLADGGLLVVAREGDFATRIHYKGGQVDKDGLPLIGGWERSHDESLVAGSDPLPLAELLSILSRAGISLVAQNGYEGGKDYPYEDSAPAPAESVPWLTSLVIEKKPGTKLSLNTGLAEIRADDEGFKTVFYKLPSEGQPIVEVVEVASVDELKAGYLTNSAGRSYGADSRYPLALVPEGLKEHIAANRAMKDEMAEEQRDLFLP